MSTLTKLTIEQLKAVREELMIPEETFYQEMKRRLENQEREFYYPENQFVFVPETLKKSYLEVMQELRVSDFDFLRRGLFLERGNNQKTMTDYVEILYNDLEVREIATLEDSEVTTEWLFHKILYGDDENSAFLREKYRTSSTLLGLDNMFLSSAQNVIDFEGTYVTLCYIKRYIVKQIQKDYGSSLNLHRIWEDYELKKEIVEDHFAEIMDVLLTTRNQLVGSRLACGNRGLSRNIHRISKESNTPCQQSLVDCIAFGHTVEELEQKNYENAKQLIFIPYHKRKMDVFK